MIDGRAVPIGRRDGSFQSIVAPPGEHDIAFRFRPSSWRIGAGISAVSVVALFFLAFSGRASVSG